MSTRTNRKTVTFRKPFSIKGIDRSLPAGPYEVVTDEELVDGLSFPVYRRVATMMLVPVFSSRSAFEMAAIAPADLSAAIRQDASVAEADASSRKAQR